MEALDQFFTWYSGFDLVYRKEGFLVGSYSTSGKVVNSRRNSWFRSLLLACVYNQRYVNLMFLLKSHACKILVFNVHAWLVCQVSRTVHVHSFILTSGIRAGYCMHWNFAIFIKYIDMHAWIFCFWHLKFIACLVVFDQHFLIACYL